MTEVGPLRYVAAEGKTFSEMRDNVRKTDLYQIGDVRLVWVNEGDLHMHARSPAPETNVVPDRMLRLAVAAVLEADTEFRSNMSIGWEGDPLSDEIDGLRRIFEGLPPATANVTGLEKTMRQIAAQKLTSEITSTTLVANDIEGTHDAMILEARAALSASPPPADNPVAERCAERFDRIATIIDRNLYRQDEKVEDAKSIAISMREELKSGSIAALADNVAGPSDTELLDALRENSWDLRCISVPTGGDDHDIDWTIVEHHQADPQERTIAQAYRDEPRHAIRRAIRETDPQAARCVSCDEVLHDGDSVYYEHGEGGHIHSWCASDDAESFVDDDEVPLKAGDEIPKPFAYSVQKYEVQS
jgi:hypothetical protein